jgi:hypothetical protein
MKTSEAIALVLSTPALAEMFHAMISPEPTSGCWLWTGWTDRKGYGRFTVRKPGPRSARALSGGIPAHRVAYLLSGLEIPPGLQLDHLCRVRPCCNPAHLEPVTSAENSRRGQNPCVVAHRAGLCMNGHPATGAPGNRTCSTCYEAEKDRAKAKRRLIRALQPPGGKAK